MSLKDTLQNDIKAALLGGNRFEGDTLRNLKAAILNEEVAMGKRDEGLDDAEIEKVVAREVKKRRESITVYEENGRPELAQTEKDEVAVLEKYLPAQLSDDEIRSIVSEVVASMGDVSVQQMGQVIGAVKAKAGNAADGAIIAKIVKEELTK
ncbi:TPA: GatB/YqeY [Candidatus Saccharibacteria bacterium]|nr:GatB/YqeY [Candidatus Saccharibacteria bacterium]HRJ90793.1 GatB/YqeY domain-containing protein [Candidatus Saccharibacteria bacterium]